MGLNTKKEAVQVRQRRFLNKDFQGLRSDLLLYSRTFYRDRITDFSETSMGGVLLDLAAYVGDVFAFYGDHQFGELFVESAVEKTNIENLVRAAGVEITGNSPAVVPILWFIEVPAVKQGTTFAPRADSLPVIEQGSVAQANNGTRFELLDELDYRELDNAGNFKADIIIGSTNNDGSPATLIMSRAGECVSGFTTTETFVIPNTFLPFRRIVLGAENITEVISVRDTDGNTYFEVKSLTQDTVFRGMPNLNSDNELVEMNLEILPAPYRFTKEMSLETKLTTLTFGGGTATSLDNDIIPDPSEFAVPLFGKTTFSRFTIDPGRLLETRTLGVAPQNTTLIVEYRFGGGLSHNVPATTIETVTKLLMKFPENPSTAIAASVRGSTSIRNDEDARGGENAPTLNELKARVPSARNAQNRIVTKEDLLARVYTMPSNFGRVFRAGVRDNPNNPLATQLFVISRDSDKKLVISPDTLKQNVAEYLNQFRMISDAIDILDARVVNLTVEFQIGTETQVNKSTLVRNIISRLQKFFDINNFQIDQPIRRSEIENIIFNNPGVMSVIDFKLKNVVGTINGKDYSDNTFDVGANTRNGLIIGPPGSIFEVRFPDLDIVGSAI